jgi:uncharacterized membrane protein
MEELRTIVLVVATLAVGLMAGVFCVYANAIMPGLRTTDDRTFVDAFRAMDKAIINPLFLSTFLGAAIATAAALVLHIDRPALPAIAPALVLYVACVAITMRINVPRNDALKAAAPTADASSLRTAFDEARWARWNRVRAVVTTVAFGCLVWALTRS